MSELEFKTSPRPTVGVELELQILKPADFDLSRDAGDLLRLLEKQALPGEIKPEITESMIELNSSVHERFDTLDRELHVLRDAIVRQAERLNLHMAGGGAHPFHKWSERRIYPTPRFKHLLARYGFLAKQFTVFGQHIHVGCASGDEAVYLVHALTRYVPHFIALSASSPFYQGEDTSFQSCRLTAVSAFPLSGEMPLVRDWDEFRGYFGKMRAFGIVDSMKDFYWDIRPKPEYGTVELRICDTPLTVHRAALLAAYAQSLAAHLVRERPYEPVPEIHYVSRFNRFEAARYGCAGRMVDPFSGRSLPIGEDIRATLRRIRPYAAAFGADSALLELDEGVARGDSEAQWLRKMLAEEQSLPDVVRRQSALWHRDTGGARQ